MKKIHLENSDFGFYGAYYPYKRNSNHARIVRIGDDPEDHRAKSAVSYLLEKGINVLARSPGKKNYSYHNYPLEKKRKSNIVSKNKGKSENLDCRSIHNRNTCSCRRFLF